MAWTQTQLAAAFNALSPVPGTLEAAAAIDGPLNSQTITAAVDVPVQSIAAYLGANMKMEGLLAWAAAPPSGASAASILAAQELAFAFEHPQLVPVFAMSIPAIATQMQDALAALVSPGSGIAGPITATDQTAILALAVATDLAWQPPVIIAQLQMAQRAGLISNTIPVV